MPGVVAGPSKAKTSFRKARVVGPLYTGGPLAVDRDGQRVVSTLGDDVVLTDAATGQRICQFQTDGEAPSSLALSTATSTSLQLLLVFTASLALHVFELPSSNTPLERPVQPIRQIARAHDAPVHVCIVDPTSSFLASGSADGVVKVWDIRRGYVTHNFRGHGGVVSALTFSVTSLSGEVQMRLFTASGDNLVRVFNLTSAASRTAGAKAELVLDGHVSVPRAICVTPDQRWLVTSGRDSVILVWDLPALLKSSASTSKKGKGKAVDPKPHRTILVQERIEAAGLLTAEDLPEYPGEVRVYAGGEKGVVRVWDALSGKELVTLGGEAANVSSKREEQQEILSIYHIASPACIATVHADQNVIFYSLTTGQISRQLIGFNDEVVDALFLSPLEGVRDSHLAVATNSSLIRVYSTSPDQLDASLLHGHTDVVLCLDRGQSGQLLASGSKDRTARIWARRYREERDEWQCLAFAEGHAESIGAIAMSRDSGAPKFMFTGSQDRTVKMWDLAAVDLQSVTAPVKLQSLTTQKAHEKDINSLDVSPNDKLLATGSQDKTVKIFAIEYRGTRGGEIKALGVCKGHKRGVWNVRFGRTERVLATGSGDKTVKMWNLEDFTCIKTFEGHTNSVLRVDFVSDSLQLMSSASDGLVKLWNIGDQECVATLDNHEDKVEQDFLNYVALNDYKHAILLGLAMDQPGRLFKLFKTVRSEDAESESPVDATSLTGHPAVDEVLRTLSAPDLARLLRHVRTWNTTARTSAVAQGILHAVLKLRSVADIVSAFAPEVVALEGHGKTDGEANGLQDLIEGLIPYSERHLTRVERLVQESYTIDFLLAEMDGLEIGPDADVDMDGI
ncbi:WD40 repeat-like protein [Exidia glandulosa HHB12029]|uniref:WD40 repeat-like protein n=1 Tax=Exidia glandulosa HHB12029 TaxID=1314781 RepID=A0A165NCW6_EXIGL|nr:WD40 repeat-like protein [Exidia glandulosa HHB12029]